MQYYFPLGFSALDYCLYPGKRHPTKLLSTVGNSISNWNQWTSAYFTARSRSEGSTQPERMLSNCLFHFLLHALLQLFMIYIWQAVGWILTDDLSQNCIDAWLTKQLQETFLSCYTRIWKFSSESIFWPESWGAPIIKDNLTVLDN